MSASVDLPRSVIFREDRLIILDGSIVCPSRAACDRKKGEHYETYIRRHAREHLCGEFDELEDAERNLFLNCFYFAHKYGTGNPSIGPDPFWEHHVFMADWSLHPADLEQGFAREKRRYRLPDYEDMHVGRIEKRFKKVQKPRGTQKSSVGRAYVTWRLLRAYYLENNPYFRVLVISATSKLGRNQWFKPLKKLWAVNKHLIRLFGMWEFTCDHCGECQDVPKKLTPKEDQCPQCGEVLGRRVRMRSVGLVTKGSFGVDNIQMRWTVHPPEDFSGMAVENLQFGGIDTELTGQRFDLVMADDLSTPKNSYSVDLREGVKDTFAEVTRQLDDGQLILSCTPYHLDDLANDIERKDGPYFEQFHIMRRAAAWLNDNGETQYYWPISAEGVEKLSERKLAAKKAMTADRNFSSQYMDQPEDPLRSSFKSDWFEFVDVADVPPPVMWGYGSDYTEEQLKRINEEHVVVDSLLYIDPAGHEEQKKRNDDTAMFGIRVYLGVVYVMLLRSFKGPDSKEKEEIYQASALLRPRLIRYFRKNNDREGALINGFSNFCIMKSQELSVAMARPVNVHLPMYFQPESTIVSKRDKIEKTEPLWRAGRVKIVRCAGITEPERIKCRDQYVGLGVTSHDDYPDAGSAMQEDVGIPTMSVVATAAQSASTSRVNEKGNIEIPIGDLLREMRKRTAAPERRDKWASGTPAPASSVADVVNSDIPEPEDWRATR
jgi:predicted nucleic acid-binding Zn ribbon protein